MKKVKRKDRLEIKDKFKRKAIALSIIAIIGSSVLWYTTSSFADEKIEVTENTIELNVEKIDRDTVKISLDNFKDVAKSMQLSVKIDGNVTFEEESIKWLVSSDEASIKSDLKLSDDKKVMDMFIVSSGTISKNSGKIDICEIDVTKNNLGDSSYRVIPNINTDGVSYGYVISDTNRQERGTDIVNLNEEKLTINTPPTIKLINSSSIVEGNIIISKGSIFNPKDFVIATDEEDGEIKDIKVEGKIDNNIVGSYGIKYTVNDSEGDIASLSTSVIVEDNVNIAEKPVIKGNREKVNIKIGEKFEPLEGIIATDYLGRNIDVVVSGEYDVNVASTYIIKYNATDRLNNKADEKITTLIVEKIHIPEPPVEPEEPEVPEPPVNPEVPEPPVNPEEPQEGFEIPNGIIDIIDTNIVKPISGNGKKETPLLLDIKDVSVDELSTLLINFESFDIKVEKITNNGEYTIFTVHLKEKKKLFKIEKDIYLELRVNNSKTELLTRLNKFGADNGLVEEKPEVPGEPEIPVNPEVPEVPGVPENPETSDKPESTEKPGNEVDTEKSEGSSLNNNKDKLPSTGQVVGTTVLFGLGATLMGCGLYFINKKKKN